MLEKGDFAGKENMFCLLVIPGERAPWVWGVPGNFFPLINLSEQGS